MKGDNIMVNPCKGCEDRNVGCHGRCEKYKQWRVKYDKTATEIKKGRQRYYFQSESERVRRKW